jgi:hypothetical protein
LNRDTKAIIAASYPAIASQLLRPLLTLMNLGREVCGGDVNKFLIISAVAVRTTMHREFAQRSQEELLSGEIPIFPALRTTIRSITQMVGLPKETVRRKVSELVDVGWLARNEGRIYLTVVAYQQLTPVREQIQLLAAHYHEVVADLRAVGKTVADSKN